MSRIAPAQPPYPPAIADALSRIMPPGVEPLLLFRVMARSPRVFAKLFAGGLLDRGPLPLRQRELVIDRTTARLGCEYEWGVHVSLFAARIGLNDEQVAATVQSPPAAAFPAEEQALLALVDDLVDRRTLSPQTWSQLTAHFDEAQILEAIALVGYYHTISFLCRGLELAPESYAARFPPPPPTPSSPEQHRATVEWRRQGEPFIDRRYSRAHRWYFDGGLCVPASSSPQVVRAPLSDPAAVDPEEAYVASLASCHMLWFLDLAARAGHVVERYTDQAQAWLSRRADGKLWLSRVELRPQVEYVTPLPSEAAHAELHQRAHDECFVAHSVRSEVVVLPTPPVAAPTT